MKEKYAITGMSCSACSTRVQKSVAKLDGVSKAEVNLLTNSMNVEYDTDHLSGQSIVEAVTKAGYGAIPMETEGKPENNSSTASSDTLHDLLQKEQKNMRFRLIGSFVFWIPLLYFSMYLMLHESYGWPIPNWVNQTLIGPENAVTHAFLQFLLVLPIIALNWKYFRGGFTSLSKRSPNMDSLVAVGSTAAVLYGIFALFQLSFGLGHQDTDLIMQYQMEIYFESAGTILTLITLGKYLESRSKAQTSKVIEKLVKLAPQTALVEKNGLEVEIPSDQVKPGDIVILKPGANVPVDGTIVSGRSLLDESAITGESIPVEKTVGDTVISASFNKNGHFKMRADKTGNQTTINQIIRLVEEASSSKAPIARLADKISGIFVPTVMIIALLTFVIWVLAGATFEFALSVAIAVLVISCPCALGLATPVAIMVGTGKGAENGILIKSGEALETAHSIDTVVLDKTGTITEGKPSITDIYAVNGSSKELLTTAAMLEKSSEHPLAEAVMAYAKEQIDLSSLTEITDFEAHFGQGISAHFQDALYLAGNESLMQKHGVDISPVKEKLDSLSEEGKQFFCLQKNIHYLVLSLLQIEKKHLVYKLFQNSKNWASML